MNGAKKNRGRCVNCPEAEVCPRATNPRQKMVMCALMPEMKIDRFTRQPEKIDFPEKSVVCLITASADAGVIEEVLAGHPVRYYHVLYFSDTDGFVHCTSMEDYLKKHAERIGHLNWNEVTCGGTDVAEVLFENKALYGRLAKMTESRDYWMKMYGSETT